VGRGRRRRAVRVVVGRFRGRLAGLRGMVVILLGQSDLLGFVVAELDAQAAAFGRNAQVAVAQSADEVEGLAGWLLLSQVHGVALHVALDGLTHVRGSAEVAVSGHQAANALVGTLEVVAVDVEPEPPLAIGEVGKDRPAQKLLPQRLPEPLYLAQRLGVLGTALDVGDPVPLERLFEVGGAPPGGVLPALVGQHLLGRPIGRHRALEGLEHQAAALVMGDGVGGEEARVVVHEDGHVEALVLAEQEREDVRLPQLIRSRPLEPARGLVPGRLGLDRLDQPLLVQNPPDLGLAHPERREPGQHVTDAAGAILGMLALHLGDGVTADGRLRLSFPSRLRLPPLLAGSSSGQLRRQPVHPVGLVAPHPLACRRLAHAEDTGNSRQRLVLIHHLLHDPQLELDRVQIRSLPRAPCQPVRLGLGSSFPFLTHRVSLHRKPCPAQKGRRC